MTAPWHVSDGLAARYASGSAPEPDAWSLEKHVEVCGGCAARVSAAVRAGASGPALADVRAALLDTVRTEVAAPHRRLGRRPALTLGRGPARETARAAPTPHPTPPPAPHPAHPPTPHPAPAPTAPTAVPHPFSHPPTPPPAVPDPFSPTPPPTTRPPFPSPPPSRLSPASRWARVLWAAGPALRGSWLVAVLVVVAAAVALAYGAGFREARPVLLALAPVLPLAGVAVSYGRHADPMYEIGVATPSGGLRLLLTRAAAVLGVCVPVLTSAGALLPPVTGVPGAAAWLLPGLALTLAALALGSFVGCRAAALTLIGGWLLAVTGPVLGRPGAGAELARFLSGPAAQGGWAAAAVACAGLLALRRRSFDHLETR
ncbi:zf-HC2 domain-containing protein [Streptomyces sp. NPDC090127]|uniref:zf-HC2 domain-containing protein n=1 Tax=Streptomyces sp. NPDC090127 TaxID=3365953 RepID=UPI00382A4EEE